VAVFHPTALAEQRICIVELDIQFLSFLVLDLFFRSFDVPDRSFLPVDAGAVDVCHWIRCKRVV
jgi:hypothetical protein